MRKFDPFFLIVALFVTSTQLFSQLYVGPSSYVYVADKYVYVKQDVNLVSTGNIYLRNEAQLLQATTGGSTNAGTGKLSAFQEGSVNNFQYNYWCSPVGNASAVSGNEAFGITMLNAPATETNSTAATILASGVSDGTSSPLAIASRWISKFQFSNTYGQWITVGSASTLAAGEGFTMKGTSGTDATTVVGVQNNSGSKQRYDFRGKPNDGNINITVANGQFTLTGNPYPSAIDLKAFLESAVNTTGIAYFWEHDKTANSHLVAAYRGGYGTYSPTGPNGIYVPATFYSYTGAGTQGGVFSSPANNYERRFCPVGQGFMIRGNALGTTVQMNNSFRVYVKEGAVNLSQFEKNANKNNADTGFLPEIPSVSGFDYTKVSTLPTPQIRFNTLLNNEGVRQMVLALVPEATDNIDRAMDASMSAESTPADIYFLIQDRRFVINVLPFDVNKKIQIGLRNTAEANFKITVKEILNFTDAQNVYIHDKDTDTYHDIKNAVYEVTMPAGTNNTRFEITFVSKTLDVNDDLIENFNVLQNNTKQNLTVANPKSLDLSAINVYDISGKLILSNNKLGTESNYEFGTSGWSEGVYIVKLTTADNKNTTKKIVVYRTK